MTDMPGATGKTVLLVGATSEQEKKLREELPSWTFETTEHTETIESVLGNGMRGVPDAVIVFAKKDEERRALSACRTLRNMPQMNKKPMMVAITIYQMILGNMVKKLPNSGFVFLPLETDNLVKRMEELEADGDTQ